jgi:uncharacterized membrane protein (DUF106 family)
MLFGLFQLLFAPLLAFQTHVSLFLIASIITTLALLPYVFLTDKKLVEEMKEKSKEIRQRFIEAQAKGNAKEISKLMNEMVQMNSAYFKQMVKPLIVATLVFILFFPWLGHEFGGKAVAKLPFSLPVVGSNLSWIGWYIIVSLTISWILKKALGVG